MFLRGVALHILLSNSGYLSDKKDAEEYDEQSHKTSNGKALDWWNGLQAKGLIYSSTVFAIFEWDHLAKLHQYD